MTLQEIIDRIVMSQPSDWHVMGGHPSYHDRFDQVESGGQTWLELESHRTVAAFKPDASITMAWGLTVNENFQEPWANRFPDSQASSHFVDVFLNGALVYREMYVSVDGARCDLPLPLERHGGRVPLKYFAFIALVERL